MDLKISIKPPSVFDIKILLRTLFRNSITLFKIITYNPQNDKVKQLIPFINYCQMRTHEKWFQLIQYQLEIAFISTVTGKPELS